MIHSKINFRVRDGPSYSPVETKFRIVGEVLSPLPLLREDRK